MNDKKTRARKQVTGLEVNQGQVNSNPINTFGQESPEDIPDSTLNQQIVVSRFRNERDNKPVTIEPTWDEFCKSLKNPVVRLSKEGPAFAPAEFYPLLRRNSNVKAIYVLVFDVDDNASIARIEDAIREKGWTAVIHTTHSHLRKTKSNTKAQPRYRVALLFKEPIGPSQHLEVWRNVATQLGIPVDESTKDPARIYYYPAIASNKAPFYFNYIDGIPLDWKKIFDKESSTVTPVFQHHEDRHAELIKRIEAAATRNARGKYDMKCPAHTGEGNTSLFYDPEGGAVKCRKGCDYTQILASFGLPTEHLHRRTQAATSEVESNLDQRAFPEFNPKALYGLAGRIVNEIINYTEAHEMALLVQILVVFGSLVGRCAFYQVEGTKHFTNEFALLVGDTAQGRKGTALKRVMQVFEGIDPYFDQNCVRSGLSSGEGLIFHVRDETRKTVYKKGGSSEEKVVDKGVSDKRLLAIEAEFANVLNVNKREGNTFSSVCRNAWDNGKLETLTKNSPLKATGAHISLVGHITTTELLNIVFEVDLHNGFLNRFLFFVTRRTKFLPHGADPPINVLNELKTKIQSAVTFANEVERMRMSRDAAELWNEAYVRLETSRSGLLARVTQRASPHTLRIAMLFALLDRSKVIQRAHLEAALYVWQYAEDSARYLFGDRLENGTAEAIHDLLRSSSEEGISRTEIRDLFDRNKTKAEIDRALRYLLDAGLARFEKVPTGGKPREVWHLADPELHSRRYDFSGTSESTNIPNVVNGVNVVITPYENNCFKCGKPLDSENRCPDRCDEFRLTG